MKPLWLVLGDTHGHLDTLRCMDWAERNNVTTVIQVGDFGANWPGEQCSIISYFKKRQRQGRQGPALYTCGGNHDNYTKINELREQNGYQGLDVELAPGCIYMERSTILVLDGRNILFFGGAVSSDAAPRLPTGGWSIEQYYPGRAEYPDDWKAARKSDVPKGAWWREEAPTPEDFEQAARDLRIHPCDVWVTHDVTTDRGLSRAGDINPLSGLPVNDTAVRLKKLYDNCSVKPKWWFHGHHHNHDDVDLYGTRIISCGIVGNKWGKNIHSHEGWLVDPATMARQPFTLR